MKIAIVDSGIDYNYQYNKKNIEKQCYIDAHKIEYVDNAKDENGHGTSCADIILRYCPNAHLYIYKIYDESLHTDPERLICALRECQREGVDIINLSLGMISKIYYKELYNLCKQLTDAGTLIIAAASDSDIIDCWPADFPFVLKVIGTETCTKEGYIFFEDSSLMVETYGGKEFVKGLRGKRTIVWGNSFACARVSGLLANQIKVRRSKFDFEVFLKENAFKVQKREMDMYGTIPSFYDILNGKKVIIFPYNKEMHSMVRFYDILKCKIIGVVDFPISKQINKDAGMCIGTKELGITVEGNFDRALNLLDVDTVILGDLSEVSRIYGKNLTEKYALRALEKYKDVVSIELLREGTYTKIHTIAKEKGKHFWALNDYITPARKSKTPNVEFRTPILCILGTGPKVGKFSFQVDLRKYLEIIGYKVCTVSTEPQGFLFGYPTVPLGNAVFLDFVSFENQIDYFRSQIIRELQKSNADILLLGGQSGVVPYNIDIQTDYNALSSIITILASKPDAFVLCVNPMDEIEYISRTITSIESFGYGKVIFCILTNREIEEKNVKGISYEKVHYLSAEQHRKKCKFISDFLKLPVFGFQNKDDIKRVIATIQDYFSED